MNLERVVALAQEAANNRGMLDALQNDPAQMRKPLQLSEDQVRALISASAFTTVRPVMTTSDERGALADLSATELLGTLLPPEGDGFPGTGELPPALSAPTATPPTTPPSQAIPAAPHSATPAPHGGRPAPHPYTPAPLAPPTAHTPQAGPTSPASSRTPGTSGTPAVRPGASPTPTAGGPMACPDQTSNASNGAKGNGQAKQTPAMGELGALSQIVGIPALALGGSSRTAGRCACDAAFVALVAQVSSTAQAALTGITAITSMG